MPNLDSPFDIVMGLLDTAEILMRRDKSFVLHGSNEAQIFERAKYKLSDLRAELSVLSVEIEKRELKDEALYQI